MSGIEGQWPSLTNEQIEELYRLFRRRARTEDEGAGTEFDLPEEIKDELDTSSTSELLAKSKKYPKILPQYEKGKWTSAETINKCFRADLKRHNIDSLTDFKHFDQLQIDDITGLELVYADVQRIYNSEFLNTDFETTVNNYNNAKSHPVKYIRLSFSLLQYATNHNTWPVKLWYLLPTASHNIVYVPLSGVSAMYDCKKRRARYASNNDLIDATHSIQLSYGLKTDRHSVSVLFEKMTAEFFALDITKYKKLKQNMDLSRIKSGVYHLYKRLIGLSENDRIIGINPGVRDIVCAVDCPQNESRIPMHPIERSRLIRWRLGWLPGGFLGRVCVVCTN
ncbi:MAG: hypothetical protein EXX96DRAFT_630843 [Benjaminiella poitrasii]|nr:MAG: hypothetical protein EXX96DRAFT_630843 [Benjaminiella poitrasii]